MEAVLMKTPVLFILFMKALRCRTTPPRDSIAFITGQGEMWTLQKVAERITGSESRNRGGVQKCNNKEGHFFQGNQLGALRKGKNPILCDRFTSHPVPGHSFQNSLRIHCPICYCMEELLTTVLCPRIFKAEKFLIAQQAVRSTHRCH